MSASTQAKPRGGRVGVRKWYIGPVWADNYRTVANKPGHLAQTKPCHVVTGYSGSAKTLKRLAEIAGMDEDSFSAWMTKVYAESSRDGKGTIKAMRDALGLSSARGGRK